MNLIQTSTDPIHASDIQNTKTNEMLDMTTSVAGTCRLAKHFNQLHNFSSNQGRCGSERCVYKLQGEAERDIMTSYCFSLRRSVQILYEY